MTKTARLETNQANGRTDGPALVGRPNVSAAAIAGILAPLVYVVAVVLGGLLDPSYSHVEAPISELTTVGAPNRWPLAVAFLVYNGLVLTCGVTLVMRHRVRSWMSLARWCLVAVAIAGAAMSTLFPSSRVGQPIDVATGVHILLALVASLCSMSAMLAVAMAAPPDSAIRRMSYVGLFAMLFSGLIAGLAAARNWPYLGIAERVTIGVFLLWLLALATGLRSRE